MVAWHRNTPCTLLRRHRPLGRPGPCARAWRHPRPARTGHPHRRQSRRDLRAPTGRALQASGHHARHGRVGRSLRAHRTPVHHHRRLGAPAVWGARHATPRHRRNVDDAARAWAVGHARTVHERVRRRLCTVQTPVPDDARAVLDHHVRVVDRPHARRELRLRPVMLRCVRHCHDDATHPGMVCTVDATWRRAGARDDGERAGVHPAGTDPHQPAGAPLVHPGEPHGGAVHRSGHHHRSARLPLRHSVPASRPMFATVASWYTRPIALAAGLFGTADDGCIPWAQGAPGMLLMLGALTVGTALLIALHHLHAIILLVRRRGRRGRLHAMHPVDAARRWWRQTATMLMDIPWSHSKE